MMRVLRLACLAVLASATVATSAASDSWIDVARKRDAAAKRCHAAQRRVERQQQVIDDLDARIARDRAMRESCERRACERLDRSFKSADTRRIHYERQLEQYRRDAASACASSSG